MKIITDTAFEARVQGYPESVKNKMDALRQLIRETAEESSEVASLHETLKWNEPSFKTPLGSTLRMDWKEKTPDDYALYFQCSSKMVDTFRMVFPYSFRYEGQRAILFPINSVIPTEETNVCIRTALLYHTVKHLPYLGL